MNQAGNNNNLDKEIYDYLTNDFFKTKNKAQTVKHGVEKYNKNSYEIEKIINDIINNLKKESQQESNTIEENTKIKEKNNKIIEKTIFKFSFFQYFIHSLIYKIIILFILIQFAINIPTLAYILCIPILYIFLRFLVNWVECVKSEFIISPHETIYRYQTRNGYRNEDLPKTLSWEHYIKYDIIMTTEVVETINHIIIYGNIMKYEERRIHDTYGLDTYKPKKKKKLVITKYFENNSLLIKELKNSVNINKQKYH